MGSGSKSPHAKAQAGRFNAAQGGRTVPYRTEGFTEETSRDIFLARLKKFSDEAFSTRMLGFAFSRAWVFLVFFNETALLAPVDKEAIHTSVYQGSLVALVLTLFVCGLLSTRCERLFAGTLAQSVPALFCIVGTLAIPFADLANTGGVAFLATASVATGIGSGLLLLLWGRVYSSEGGPSAAAEISVSYVLATLLVPFYQMAALVLQQLVLAVLPIASTALLVLELRRIKAEPSEEATRIESDEGRIDHGYASMLAKFAVTSVVFGCVIGVVRFFYTASGPAGPGHYPMLVFPLAALLVGGVMLGILLLSKRLDLAFSYKPVLLFMAAGCLLLPFSDANLSLSYTFALAGYFCFEIVSWVMLSDMSFRFDVPPFRAYGFGRCAVSGGVLLGSLLTSWLAGNMELTAEFRFAVACLMTFAAIATYTFTLTERDIARVHRRSMDRYREGGVERNDAAIEMPRGALTLEDKVDIVAEEHGISGRALEVMLLLAQGRTATRIEQELYISRGTVNTYSHRLYQKLGVHSRQELLDLIYEAGE